MQLSSLNQEAVLQINDVSMAREGLRRRRFRKLAFVLALVAIVVVGRTVWAAIQFARGHYSAAAGDFTWHVLPHIPSADAKYVPAGVLILVLVLAVGAPLLGAGRSPHVLYRPEDIDTRLSDVVGAGGVVEDVTKSLNLFLAHATFRSVTGGSSRRGILFEGPPGTGKTYLAKAMAGEANVPFLFVSSSAFQSMYYGQTNRKIRSYFRALRAHARREGGAIGFIEEIDAIGASRGGMGGGGREGVAGVVNELLIQMQSFDQPTGAGRLAGFFIDVVNRWLPAGRRIRRRPVVPANVLIIGATNRAQDLDPALLRPGRFDRTITIGVPNRAGRREILDYYLARKAHEAILDDPKRRDELAGSTFGYTPVMLEHLLDEALVWALRRNADRLGWEDVNRAKMTEELGLAQDATYTEGERVKIATHESGHATVAHLIAPQRRLDVLSVIKRRDALGLLAHSEREERWLQTRSELASAIRIAMGGLVAEELFYGEASSGVSGDLQAATRAAAHMVGSFGMTGSLLSFDAAPGGDIVAKVLSDDSARAAADALLSEARTDAEVLLRSNLDVVTALRDALLERDELIGEEITDVIEQVIASRQEQLIDLRAPGTLGERGPSIRRLP